MNVRAGLAGGCLILGLACSTALGGEISGRVTGGQDGPVVVWVEGLEGEAPSTETPITHVAGGAFELDLSVGYVGAELVLGNEDKVLHNTHLYMRLDYQKDLSGRPLELGSTVYNVALPRTGQEVRRTLKPYHRYREETGFIEVICNAHPEERAFLLVFDHPYAVSVDDDGTFSLPDVPAGTHEVRYWHDGAVNKMAGVEVSKKGASTVEINLGAVP